MDHFVGLNFSANFNFALVGHLLKGTAPSEMHAHRWSEVSYLSQDKEKNNLNLIVHDDKQIVQHG